MLLRVVLCEITVCISVLLMESVQIGSAGSSTRYWLYPVFLPVNFHRHISCWKLDIKIYATSGSKISSLINTSSPKPSKYTCRRQLISLQHSHLRSSRVQCILTQYSTASKFSQHNDSSHYFHKHLHFLQQVRYTDSMIYIPERVSRAQSTLKSPPRIFLSFMDLSLWIRDD